MPIPTPNKGEKRGKFLSKCVAVLNNMKEFKNNSVRYAVCIQQWEKKKKKKSPK